jgi:histidinol phosphatase-like enzyme (inositol monophosphatase family)
MAAENQLNDELLRFAHALADAAAAAIMPHYRKDVATEDKGGPGAFDPVTVADRAAEAAMRELITAHYPTHGIIGEEYGRHQDTADFVWVLDPIDGTKSFITGIPLWGTLIGVLKEGSPHIGLSNHPFLQERFWGDGHEAFGEGPLGRKLLTTRKPVQLADAVLMTGTSTIVDEKLDANWRALQPRVRMLRYGSDCYDSNMLAEGHIDGILQRGLEIYDIAALVPIVEGAGGIITGFDGKTAIHSSVILSSGDAALHAQVLDALAK